MRLILFFLSLLVSVQLAAAEPPVTFQTGATEAILIDAGTGAILFEKNADKLFAPASMSKIMTLEILFKKLKAGEISMDTEFPVSLYAWRTGGAPSRTTSMFVPLNQTAKVADLVQGIAVQNANDGAIAVAEGLAGTDDAFGQMMTEEARALGLEKSTFGNSSGLPNPANLVTARELAKLSLYVIKEYPDYYKYFGQKEFKFRSYNFKNINPLLSAAIPVDGLKLGFTENVGYGIAASAEKDGRRLVTVMNGFAGEKERREEISQATELGLCQLQILQGLRQGRGCGGGEGLGRREMERTAQNQLRGSYPASRHGEGFAHQSSDRLSRPP